MSSGPGRSVGNHLLEGEEVQDYFMSDQWAWVSTNRRLIKYRETDSGFEELQDLSYDEISGISLTHEGREDWPKWLAAAAGALTIILFIYAGQEAALTTLLVALLAAYVWYNSESSYFEFRGSGVIQQEPDAWRIETTDIDEEQELNEFVKSVRERL